MVGSLIEVPMRLSNECCSSVKGGPDRAGEWRSLAGRGEAGTRGCTEREEDFPRGEVEMVDRSSFGRVGGEFGTDLSICVTIGDEFVVLLPGFGTHRSGDSSYSLSSYGVGNIGT
jgi:hypothetical protein